MTVVRPFMRKLEQLGPLGGEERRLLESLSFNGVTQFDAGQDLAREGERPAECKLIVDGYACRYKPLFLRLYAGELAHLGFPVDEGLLDREMLLYRGDLVGIGKGEVFTPAV